jgi:hypothetical protein
MLTQKNFKPDAAGDGDVPSVPVSPKKTGRPPGSKNKPRDVTPGETNVAPDASTVAPGLPSRLPAQKDAALAPAPVPASAAVNKGAFEREEEEAKAEIASNNEPASAKPEEAVSIPNEINALNTEIVGFAAKTIANAIRVGELLTAKKEEPAHGEYLPWIENNLTFGPDMAERYRLIYARREEIPIDKIATIRQALKFLNKSNKLTVSGEAGPTRKSKKIAAGLALEAAEAAAGKKALLASIGITEPTAPEPEAVTEPASTIESAPTNESAPTPENFEKVWEEIHG